MKINSESSFSRFIIRWLKLKKLNIIGSNIVDIGCGNSRDSAYFKKIGINVTGIDQSLTAIKLNKKKFPLIEYFVKDICSKNFNLKSKKFDYLYARFFIHAISDKQETQFLKNCKIFQKKTHYFCLNLELHLTH